MRMGMPEDFHFRHAFCISGVIYWMKLFSQIIAKKIKRNGERSVKTAVLLNFKQSLAAEAFLSGSCMLKYEQT